MRFSPDGHKLLIGEYVSITELRLYVADTKTGELLQVTPAKPVAKASQCIQGDIAAFLSSRRLAYTQTILGARQQPLGFAIIAVDKENLTAAFRTSGWLPAARPSLHSWFKLVRSGMDYIDAPLVPAFWHGRLHDFAFEKKVIADNEQGILTARLWKTPYGSKKGKIFVGVTMMYAGMHWGFFHTIAPDVDAARNSLLQSFRKAGLIASAQESPLVKPMVGSYFSQGEFFSRGKLMVIELTPVFLYPDRDRSNHFFP
jgi:hypothetical protein